MTRRRKVAFVARSRGRSSRWRCITPRAQLLAVVVALQAAALFAAGPSINSISLRGLQIGGKTTIAIDGNDLLPEPRVILTSSAAPGSNTSPITEQTIQ